MANLAKAFYENLQLADLADEPQRNAATEEILGNINARLITDQHDYLNRLITGDEIAMVLKMLPNNKATGIDGLPYEFWKWLNKTVKTCTDEQETNPLDIIKCLTMVFNNIKTHGVDPESGFSDGWLCPLYKKNDHQKIENYCPITLLNGDYKIFTKILSLQLAKTAPDVIHPNQAGFIQG